MKKQFWGWLIFFCALFFECYGMDDVGWIKIDARYIVNMLGQDDSPDLMEKILRSNSGSVFYKTRLVVLNQDGEIFTTYPNVFCLNKYEKWEHYKRLSEKGYDLSEYDRRCAQREYDVWNRYLWKNDLLSIYDHLYCYRYRIIFFYDKVKFGQTEVYEECLGLLLGTTDEDVSDGFRMDSEFDARAAGAQSIRGCIGPKSFYITRSLDDEGNTKYMRVVIFAEDLSQEEDGCLRVIEPDGFRKSHPIVQKRFFMKCVVGRDDVGRGFPRKKNYLEFIRDFCQGVEEEGES